MTKKEIVKQIAIKHEQAQVLVKDIVQDTFDLIVKTLVDEGRIELRNFGVFEVKRRKPRQARNPRTNESVMVQAKNVVTFQPGKMMEAEVKHAKVAIEPKRRPAKKK
jgi:integration host factor subunit beta